MTSTEANVTNAHRNSMLFGNSISLRTRGVLNGAAPLLQAISIAAVQSLLLGKVSYQGAFSYYVFE